MKSYLTQKAVVAALREFVRDRGFRKAGYFLNEAAADAIGQSWTGHVRRHVAAKALLAGAVITLDLGWNGQLTERGESVQVSVDSLAREAYL